MMFFCTWHSNKEEEECGLYECAHDKCGAAFEKLEGWRSHFKRCHLLWYSERDSK